MNKQKSAELKKIFKFCIENGVKTLKIEGIEVEFFGQDEKGLGIAPRPSLESKDRRSLAAVSDLGTPDEEAIPPNDDDLLFWSCGYSPSDQRKASEHEESA